MPIKDLINGGLLRMPYHKLVISIGGSPDSTAETKLYKSVRVSAAV